jgi:hypothetical protein
MTHPSGRFHRWTLLWPRVTLAGSTRSLSVRCRFHTCRPVYRRFTRIVVTAPSVHPAPVRCALRPGSAADEHGTPASFSARRFSPLSARPAAGRRSTGPSARSPGQGPGGAHDVSTRHAPCSDAARHPRAGTRTAGGPLRLACCHGAAVPGIFGALCPAPLPSQLRLLIDHLHRHPPDPQFDRDRPAVHAIVQAYPSV